MASILSVYSYVKSLGTLFYRDEVVATLNKSNLRCYDTMRSYIENSTYWHALTKQREQFTYHFDKMKAMSDIHDYELPSGLKGNHQTLRFIKSIFDDMWELQPYGSLKEEKKYAYANAPKITQIRSNNMCPPIFSDGSEHDFQEYLNYRFTAESLHKVANESNSSFNALIKLVDPETVLKKDKQSKFGRKSDNKYDSNDKDFFKTENPFMRETVDTGTPEERGRMVDDHGRAWGRYMFYRLWDFHIIVKFKNKQKNQSDVIDVFFLPSIYFQRAAEFFVSLGNMSMSFRHMNLQHGSKDFSKGFLELLWKMYEEDPDFPGEWLKSARNIYVCRLDEDKYMGQSMESLMFAEFDDRKQYWCRRIMDFYDLHLISLVDKVMFSHIYKIIPHPDTNLKDGFEKIKGLKEPNETDKESLRLFEGTLRKSLYLSMREQGYQVRVVSGDPALVGVINATSTDINAIRQTQAIRFAGLKFAHVHELPDFLKMEIPVGDKSSATSKKVSKDDHEEMREYSKHSFTEGVVLQEKYKYKNVNDIVSVLKGTDEFDAQTAYKRFENVVRSWERMEKTLGLETPEKMTSEQIEEFLKANPENEFQVYTEPKLGEKHKKVTRMFYLGEQMLKILTQKTERLGKQISKRQVGVSIVKTYSSRRKDIEAFCDIMRLPQEGVIPLFISFDMSQFSMKFPMELLRIYGEILAELTGYDALRRIDLFFKSSRVHHMTRGFYNSFTGARGGFEGFLNFIWSSIHATVMEIALAQLGLKGYLLTYSDDGLLQLLLKDTTTKERVAEIVYTIQRKYKAYGLVFNIGKTLISSTAWEYLGDICTQGHLLQLFHKELMAFGIFELTEGFHSIASRKEALSGQASSLCFKGFPPYTAEMMLITEVLLLLHRISPGMHNQTKLAMMLLPASCGGLRVPPALELASSSSVHPFSEFIADLSLFESSEKRLISSLVGYLLENMSAAKDAFGTIMMGNYISLEVPDVSGNSISNNLVTLISDKVTMTKGSTVQNSGTAFSRNQLSELAEIFMQIQDLNPLVVSEFLLNSPQWKAYSDLMSLVRSKSALRLLSRKTIKNAQSKDTRNFRDSIEKVTSYVTRTFPPTLKVSKVWEQLDNKFMKDYSIVRPRTSARILFSKEKRNVTSHPDIRVTIDLSVNESCTMFSLPYSEPSLLTSNNKNMLLWKSEGSNSKVESYLRKFLNVCTSLVSRNHEVYGAFQHAAAVLGVYIPPIPAQIGSNIVKLRSYMSSRADFFGGFTSAVRSRSTVYPQNTIKKYFNSPESIDRTTYIESLRLISAMGIGELGYYSKIIRGNNPGTGLSSLTSGTHVETFDYTLTSRDIFHWHNTPMVFKENAKLMPMKIVEQPSASVIGEFNSALDEAVRSSSLIASVREPDILSLEENKENAPIVTEIITNDVAQTIMKTLTGQYYLGPSVLIVSPVAIGLLQPILLKAYVRVFVTQCIKNREKKQTLSSYMDGDPEYPPLEFLGVIREFVQSCERNLIYLPKTLYNQQLVAKVLTPSQRLRDNITEFLYANLLEKVTPQYMITFENPKDLHQLSTPSRVAAFKSVLERVLNALFTYCSSKGWDMEEVKGELIPEIKNIDVDWLIDHMILTLAITRSSEHRNTPYNKTTFVIESVKYYAFIYHHMYDKEFNKVFRSYKNEALRSELQEEVNHWIIPRQLRDALIKRFRLAEKDVDHMKMLISPVLEQMRPRAVNLFMIKKQYLREDAKLYQVKDQRYYLRGGLIDYHNLVHYGTLAQTSIYHVYNTIGVLKINVYATSTKYHINEDLTRVQELQTKIFDIPSNQLVTPGTHIQGKELKPSEAYFAGAFLVSTMSDLGLIGDRVSTKMPQIISHILSVNNAVDYSLGGKSLINYNELTYQNNLSVFRVRKPEDACSIVLAYERQPFAKAIACENSEGYVVVGFSQFPIKGLVLKSHKNKVEKNALDTFILDQNTQSKVDSMLLSDMDSYTETLCMVYNIKTKVAQLPAMNPLKLMIPTALIPETDEMKKVDTRKGKLVSSPLLIAAAALSTGVVSDISYTGAYICLLAFLSRDTNNGETSMAAMNRVIPAFIKLTMSRNKFLRHALQKDVSVLSTWLGIQKLSVPNDMSGEVAEVLELLQSGVIPVTLDAKVILPGRPVDISEIEELEGMYCGDPIFMDPDEVDWLLEGLFFEKIEISDLSSTDLNMLTGSTRTLQGTSGKDEV